MKPRHILLVEDSASDAFITKSILSDCEFIHRLDIITNGEEALNTICNNNSLNGPQPDLILLDLNLPKLSGFEVLRELKSNPLTAHIPIMILSSSNSKMDIEVAERLKANFYMLKPLELDVFLMNINMLDLDHTFKESIL